MPPRERLSEVEERLVAMKAVLFEQEGIQRLQFLTFVRFVTQLQSQLRHHTFNFALVNGRINKFVVVFGDEQSGLQQVDIVFVVTEFAGEFAGHALGIDAAGKLPKLLRLALQPIRSVIQV